MQFNVHGQSKHILRVFTLTIFCNTIRGRVLCHVNSSRIACYQVMANTMYRAAIKFCRYHFVDIIDIDEQYNKMYACMYDVCMCVCMCVCGMDG